MTNFIKILLISLTVLIFTSCSKEPKNHKIRYDITFSQTPDFGFTNFIELGATPSYSEHHTTKPAISYEIAKTGHWDYEYLELKEDDKVSFSLWTADGYYFEMRIYIDDTQVSYKKMYGTRIIEQSGWGTGTTDTYIEFTYHE